LFSSIICAGLEDASSRQAHQVNQPLVERLIGVIVRRRDAILPIVQAKKVWPFLHERRIMLSGAV